MLKRLSRTAVRVVSSCVGTPARPGRPSHLQDGTDPLDFVKPETIDEIYRHLSGNRSMLFQMNFAREVVARDRAERLLAGAVDRAKPTENVAFGALEYNFEGARTAPNLDRPMLNVNVATSIERIYKNRDTLDVLAIGPRSEIEIFGLRGAGFSPERIRAIDLFTYSPFIESGDMHDMRFADNSFDVVFLSWVLPYSKDPGRACQEVVRVARDRAVVAVASDYTDEHVDRPQFNNEVTHTKTVEQLLGYFEPHVRTVYFRHEPDPPHVFMVMTVFDISK
jgi:methyltransferase family protein